MPIIDLLERNSKLYGPEVALVEINPEIREEQRVTWKEYELIQPTSTTYYRRQITWSVFDEKANRVANMLLERGIRKGQKVAVLLMDADFREKVLASADPQEIAGLILVSYRNSAEAYLSGSIVHKENISVLIGYAAALCSE